MGRLTVVGLGGQDRFGLSAFDSATVESVNADHANRNRRVLKGRVTRLAGDPDILRRILSLKDCLPEAGTFVPSGSEGVAGRLRRSDPTPGEGPWLLPSHRYRGSRAWR